MTSSAPYIANMGENQPPADLLGWCHQCGVVQAGSDAQHVNPYWIDSHERLWCCVTPGCHEPWGLGVWIASPCDSCRPGAVQQAAAHAVNWNGVCRAVEFGDTDCETGEPTSARSAQE